MGDPIHPDDYKRSHGKASRARAAEVVGRIPSAIISGLRTGTNALGITANIPAAAPSALPRELDPRDENNLRLATPVRRQPNGDKRCTAYAVCAVMEAWWCRSQESTADVPYLSVAELFANARSNQVIDDAVAAAQSGVTDEVCFPPESSTKGANPEAHTWTASFARISQSGNVVDSMRRALLNGPLAAAILIYENFPDHVGTTEPYYPSDANIGGHAVCIVGYDAAAPGFWIVKNSYGDDWGEEGYTKLPWNNEYLQTEKIVFGVKTLTHP
jgi:hypothetical protein